jgi:hypothetical protein
MAVAPAICRRNEQVRIGGMLHDCCGDLVRALTRWKEGGKLLDSVRFIHFT